MVKTSIKAISTIVVVLITFLGLWGSWYYSDKTQWIQNLWSDTFGAGILATLIFITIIIVDFFD